VADTGSIFRKVSLDRLSSPEQLDQKLTVITPIGWIAMISLAVLILAAAAWGYLGAISNKVSGSGVLMFGNGIVSITSQTSGQVTDVSVKAGDDVQKGQVIARVAQEDLERQITQVKDHITALQNVNVENLDLSINSLNNDIYSQFSPIAGQIRAARVQYEAQKEQAKKGEQDVTNQKAQQAQQIASLQKQIATQKAQISEYGKMLDYQRKVNLENAKSTDSQQDSSQTQVGLSLAQLQDNLATARQDLANNQVLFDQGVISAAELKTYSDNVASLESQIATERLNIRNNAPKSYDQLANSPDYDPTMASMQSQLESLQLQLSQAQANDAQLNNSFTDYLWGAYNQTGDQISSLTEQFDNQKQVLMRDYLKQLNDLQTQYNEKSAVTAQFAGTVSGLTVQPYDYIQPGSVLGNIIRGGLAAGSSNVILYVPMSQGKLVSAGMEADISPTTVKSEEHGYIIGKVISVSGSSVTQDNMMAILQNQQLVQIFGGQTAVMEVDVQLLPDKGTVSGYKWSTPEGPPFTISPGTLCGGQIRVSDQRPVDLVVPFIKKLFSNPGGAKIQ